MYKGEDLWKKPEIQVVKKTLSNGKVITTYPDCRKIFILLLELQQKDIWKKWQLWTMKEDNIPIKK